MPQKIKQQLAKFNGIIPGARQIYTIGKKSFPANVWVEVTKDELASIIGGKMTEFFEFNPAVDIAAVAETPSPSLIKKKPRRTK